ncbi:MAG: lipid-transfer protein [Streptosporangiales bacterium]|nr:lipid-transfer protein [Streptosporangiales bacterium]
MIRGKVAIVGIGQTEFVKASPKSAWELAMEAVLAALADAGVDPAEVDGMCRYTPPFEPVSEPMLVRGLGIRELRFFSEAPLGGEALGAVMAHGASAIVSGQASVVVAYRAMSQSVGGRFGRADGRPGGADGGTHIVVPEEENRSFSWPYGLMSPGQLFALWATRYMHVHRLSEEDLARALGTVALQQRRYANNNPCALMRDRRLDWETYLGARVISWPLRLFDLCLENDGACAVVLTGTERARALRADPVYLLAATQTLAPYREPMGIYTEDLLELFTPAAAARLWQGAGVGPGDVSVAELYDATSFMTMKSLEGYGFAAEGQGWKYLIEEGIGPDAPLPVNTHGGHLSEGYIHGMNGLTEAVRQLRGTACNQVPDASVALVGAPSGSAVVLAR